MAKIVSTEKARQGGTGRRVLTILVCGLLLAAVVWGGVEIYGALIAPTDVGSETTAPGSALP